MGTEFIPPVDLDLAGSTRLAKERFSVELGPMFEPNVPKKEKGTKMVTLVRWQPKSPVVF